MTMPPTGSDPKAGPARDGVIHQLDPVVANQIAAGEVVERPFSVVKELLENSLDAGATRVRVLLLEGGRERIEVVDNGSGLSPTDARLAFARHATSKLQAADELLAISTYGFRGEALASILSVAAVTLSSRRVNDTVGVRLRGAGGVDLEAAPVGCPVGTSVVVEDLFFNVPARLKFLRTAATELGHVIRLIDATALAHPALHVTLLHNDRKVVDYPPDADLARRVQAVLGDATADRLFVVEADGDYRVRGLLSEPSLSKSGPGALITLVDGRPVRDRTLQHAVAQAYGTLLDRGRYPVGVIAIDCPEGTVDVNVHPTKNEVRFVSTQAVHRAVEMAIRAVLERAPWVTASLDGGVAGVSGAAAASAGQVAEPGAGADDGRRLGTRPRPLPRGATWSPGGSWARARSASDRPNGSQSWLRQRQRADATAATTVGSSELPLAVGGGPYSGLRYIGQAGACFLVCESADRLVLIDQHAAHERVLFERFVVALRDGSFPSQRLLIPEVVALAPTEVAALAEDAGLLGRLGFEVEPSGERAVLVRAAPEILRGRQITAEVRRLAESLDDGGRGQQTTERLERYAATLACHAAVRKGDVMGPEAVRDLLEAMDAVDLAAWCPHGRPAVATAGFDEVGRWFNRT